MLPAPLHCLEKQVSAGSVDFLKDLSLTIEDHYRLLSESVLAPGLAPSQPPAVAHISPQQRPGWPAGPLGDLAQLPIAQSCRRFFSQGILGPDLSQRRAGRKAYHQQAQPDGAGSLGFLL